MQTELTIANCAVIRECDKRVIAMWMRSYKVQHVLQSMKIFTPCDSTSGYDSLILKQKEKEVAKLSPHQKIKTKVKKSHNSELFLFRSAVHNLPKCHKWRLQRRNGRQRITRVFELCRETERNGKRFLH